MHNDNKITNHQQYHYLSYSILRTIITIEMKAINEKINRKYLKLGFALFY